MSTIQSAAATPANVIAQAPAARGPDRRRWHIRYETWLAALLAIHLPLGPLLRHSPVLATIHALLALAIALALVAGKRIERVAYGIAYIAGAEVLWRAGHAHVFWEYGKYACALVLICGIARTARLRWYFPPLIYFALLVPSILVNLTADPWVEVRDDVSFNLSGPFVLMLALWFFRQIRLNRAQFRTMMAFLLAPIVSVTAMASYSTLTSGAIDFSDASNFAASGGFGPNQVSAVLGLGVLVAFFGVLDTRSPTRLRLLLLGVAVFCATQSALTFSRGGLLAAGLAAAAGAMFLLRDARSRVLLVAVSAIVFAVADLVVLPRLDRFTGGELQTRFEDTDTTGRLAIALDDLAIWIDHPVVGVGPGRAERYRRTFGEQVAAHTEYTRLLAEHGMLGAVSLLLLFAMAAGLVLRTRNPQARAITAAFATWSLLSMFHVGMRVAAISIVFGLAAVHLTMPAVVRRRRTTMRPDATSDDGAKHRPTLHPALP